MDINEYQEKIKEYKNYPEEIGPYSTILSLTKNIGKLSEKLNDVLINLIISNSKRILFFSIFFTFC